MVDGLRCIVAMPLRWVVLWGAWVAAAGFFAGLVALTVWGHVVWGRPAYEMVGPAVFLVMFAGIAASSYLDSRSLPSVMELERAEHPRLWCLIEAAARSVAAPIPLVAGIALAPAAPVAVVASPRRSARLLILSAVDVVTLSSDDLRALVARCLAEAHDPSWLRRSTLAGQVAVAWRSAGPTTRRSTRRLAAWHRSLTAEVCRKHVIDLDGWTGDRVGRQRLAHAMSTVAIAQEVHKIFELEHLQPAFRMLRRPIDLLTGFHSFAEKVDLEAFYADEEGRGPTGSSTPTMSERTTALLEPAPAGGATGSSGSAVELFADGWGTLELLEDAFFRGSGLTPMTWDELAHLRSDIAVREVARRGVAALGISTVDVARLVGLLGHPSDARRIESTLADVLRPEVNAQGSDPHALAEWLACLLAVALVDAGGRFVQAWPSGSVLVVGDRAIDVFAAASDAAEGDLDLLRLLWIDHELPAVIGVRPGEHALERSINDSDPVVFALAVWVSWGMRPVVLLALDTGLAILRATWRETAVASNPLVPDSMRADPWRALSGREAIDRPEAEHVAWQDIESFRWHRRRKGRGRFFVALRDGPRRSWAVGDHTVLDDNFVDAVGAALGSRLTVSGRGGRRGSAVDRSRPSH